MTVHIMPGSSQAHMYVVACAGPDGCCPSELAARTLAIAPRRGVAVSGGRRPRRQPIA